MLKNSTRNCAPKRSPHLKFLATERSTLRNPVSRKMLRPIVPNVPSGGGINTELPAAKHPNAARASLANPGLPPSTARALAAQAALPGLLTSPLPGKNGIPTGVDLKSFVLPKKSQRSESSSPVPLTSVLLAIKPKGCDPYKL